MLFNCIHLLHYPIYFGAFFILCIFFDFVPNPQFDFLASLSKKFNIPVVDDRLIIPPVMGAGSKGYH
jgi:hypothetical protein